MDKLEATMEKGNINEIIVKFRKLISGGIKKIKEGCELYVSEIDKDESARYKFMDANPDFPQVAWKRFEQVGRGTLAAELLLGGCSCVDTISKAPISVQREIVKHGLPIIQNGKINKVPISEVTSDMARLAISKDGQIRTKQEQEELANRRNAMSKTPSEKTENAEKHDWVIRGSRVKFLSVRFYTKSELLQIIEGMK